MKPLLRTVVALSLLLAVHAHPENIEEVKELPQTKEPIVEAEESEPQARVGRCTTCGTLNLNVKSPKDVLAALQALPGAEVHTQQSFEGCSTDKGCAGIKVKDGQIVQRYGNTNAFKAAEAADTSNEFNFLTAASLAANPFWWMNQDGPFKNGGSFEKFSKSSFSSSAGGSGFSGALNLAANPFLNGDFAGNFAGSVKPTSNFQSSSFESSYSSKGDLDLTKNPFLNGGFKAGAFGAGQNAGFAGSNFAASDFAQGGLSTFGAQGAGSSYGAQGAAGDFSAQGAASFGSSASNFGASGGYGSNYAGSSPRPFGSGGSNVNLVQTAQKDFDFSQQAQQNIDDLFQGSGNVGTGGLQQTCAGQGYVCVPKSQCNNGVVNSNGANILQANTKKQYCNIGSEICCRLEISSINSQSSYGGQGLFQSSFGTSVPTLAPVPVTPIIPVPSPNFIDSDSFSAGSETAGVYRPGAVGLKPGIPYLPPIDSTNSGTNIISTTAFPPPIITTPRPITPKPFIPITSTSAPGYLPPIGEQTINRETIVPPSPNYVDGGIILDENRNPRPKPTPIPVPISPNDIPAGCAAALKCTPVEFCTAEGVISNTSVILTRDQDAYRVPLTDCRDLETGRIGKCCRDPFYTDPWPTNQLGKWVPGVFGGNDGKYVPDNSGSANNVRPVTPPSTGSVLFGNYLTTPKPTIPGSFGSSPASRLPTTVTPFVSRPTPGVGQFTKGGPGGQGQYGLGGRVQTGLGGRGQVGLGTQGQVGVAGQGQLSQVGKGQFGLGTQGQFGRGQVGVVGQGDVTQLGVGQIGVTGQGKYGQVGRGQAGIGTQGQFGRGQAGVVGQGEATLGVGQIGVTGQGQYAQVGRDQIGVGGQGQYNQVGRGQIGVVGQGEATQLGIGQIGVAGQGQYGQVGRGQVGIRGQGVNTQLGVGQVGVGGQGQYSQVGRGQVGVGQAVGVGQSQLGVGRGQFSQVGRGQVGVVGQGQNTQLGVGQIGRGQTGIGQIGQAGIGQQGLGGIGQVAINGQTGIGQQGQGGVGQVGINGQGQYSQVGRGQVGIVGQGVGQVGRGQIGVGQGVGQGQFGSGVVGQGTTTQLGVGQIGVVDQGEYTQLGNGQIGVGGQGQYAQVGRGQIGIGGAGQVGAGSQVTNAFSRGQGQGVGGLGQIGSQGQGLIVSQGQGEVVSQGQGQLVSQGEGQIISQGQGQYGLESQGQFGVGSQGQFGVGSQGQFGVGSQEQFGVGGLGQGQGFGIINQANGLSKASGQLVSQTQGQKVTQEKGQIVSLGKGQIVTQGNGQTVSQGVGQIVSQGNGEAVSQGVGQVVSQGNGQIVSQGKGQYITSGKGTIVTQGGGAYVSQGEGQTVSQGFGTGINQGQGISVSQGNGVGVENEYGESVQRVFLQRYNGAGQCGILNPQRPYGNKKDLEVDFAEIPWQAMVLLQTNRSLLCGGVITRPDVVVTSAACVEGLDAKNVLIKGGEWKLGIFDEPLPFQIVQVKHILRHPLYRSGSLLYDAAVLVLSENLQLSKNIYPICLPSSSDSIDAYYNGVGECIVTGWGKIVLQAHLEGAIMHSVNVSLLNPGECQAKLSSDYPHLLEQYNEDSCVCGQPANPLNNICKVDIGSALACTDGNGRYVMQGVYSWDSGCQLGNQLASFYKFDLEWYEWSIGLIESVRFTQYTTITTGKIIGQVKGSGVKTTQFGTGVKTSQFGTGIKTSQFGGSVNTFGSANGQSSGSGGIGFSGVKGFAVSGKGQFGFEGAGQAQNQGQFSTGELSQFATGKFGSGQVGFDSSGFNTQIKSPISNTYSATYSEKKVFQTEPKIITYTTKPEIVTFTTKPEIFTFTTKPKIITYTTKPKIVTYTTKPKIITYTTKPQIITYETSGSGTNPQYVAPGISFNPNFSDLVGHKHDAQCKCAKK